MSFKYSTNLIENGLSYGDYRSFIKRSLTQPSKDEQQDKMRPYLEKNDGLMDKFDTEYRVSDDLKTVAESAPISYWLVLTEGWCGDAAFNVPMLAALEKAVPNKVKLKLLLRDSNLDLMDAHLTEGGRSIPKLIVLSENLKELGSWGPRPAALQKLMKGWKSEGLALNDIIPKVHAWYKEDETKLIQKELITLIKSYS